MKSFAKTTLASIFAASLLAGTAIAQSNPASDPGMANDKGPSLQEKEQMLDQNSTGSIGSGNLMSNEDVTGWQAGKINVVAVDTLNDVDPNKALLKDRMKTNPDDVAALQSAIENNPALKAQLESQNVQLNNVVAAQQATDGSVTFYVQ